MGPDCSSLPAAAVVVGLAGRVVAGLVLGAGLVGVAAESGIQLKISRNLS